MCLEDEKIKMALGKNIKRARLNLKLTQDELSEKINISTQLLKDIEAGRRLGSLTTFINLCFALDTTPNQILYELFEQKQKYDEDLVFRINKLSAHDKNIIVNLIENMEE